jgi:hypothetical protein
LLALASRHVSQLDLNEEKAHILRVRVERALAYGDRSAARMLVAKLEKLASAGASTNIQRIYHGAAGTLLVDEKRYSDAVPHLAEDIANPLSMKLLIIAYHQTGDAEEAASSSKRLLQWKVPSVEEVLATSDSPARGAAVAIQK